MFDGLRKKLSGFVNSIVKKKDEEVEEPFDEELSIDEVKQEEVKQTKKDIVEKKEERKKEEPKEKKEEKKKEKPKHKEIKVERPKEPEIEKLEIKKPIIEKPKSEEPDIKLPENKLSEETKLPETKFSEIKLPESRVKKEEKKEKKVNIGIFKKVTSILSRNVKITEQELEEYLEMLELELLEADVAYEVSQEIIEQIKNNLAGIEVPKDKLQETIEEKIKAALISVMDLEGPDIFEQVKNMDKPVKILFVGPNGAGKTTTVAKFTHKFQKQGNSVLMCASDTFRAAAIEQLQVHADRLKVPLIKSKYGADPASVGFDAVNHARKQKIDIVLIDSAGRQDTNYNLMEELKKINRIVKPDYVIYVGESLVGNAIVDQINAFKDTIKIDGVILSKLDCDAKGGSSLSVAHATGIPILYVGVGQGYDDLVRFDPKEIVERMI